MYVFVIQCPKKRKSILWLLFPSRQAISETMYKPKTDLEVFSELEFEPKTNTEEKTPKKSSRPVQSKLDGFTNKERKMLNLF